MTSDADTGSAEQAATPARLVRFVCALSVMALAVTLPTVLAGTGVLDGDIGPVRGWWVAAGAVVMAAGQSLSSLVTFRGHRRETRSHDEVVYPFLLVFLGPAGAIVAVLAGTAMANAVGRRPLLKAMFNVSKFTLAAGAGSAVAWGFATLPGLSLQVASVAAGSFVFALVDMAVFARLLHHLNGRPWWDLLRAEFDEDGTRYAAEVLLGITAALATQAVPPLGPVAILTVVVVLETHRRWFAIARDRQRLEDLLSVATSLHGAVSVDDVDEALIAAVRTMTSAEASFVAELPNEPGTVVMEMETEEVGALRLLQVVRQPPLEETEILVVHTLARVAEVSMRVARLLEMRAEQSRELAELIAQREEFLTGTAHQLRTPMTAILGFGHMLLESPADTDSVKEMANHIVGEAALMANLLDNLLIASRAVTGSLLVAPEQVSLELEAARVVEELTGGDSTVIPVVGAATAIGDPIRVRQILRNLLRNALQHGGGDIALLAGATSGRAWVEVSDAGQGVGPENAETVFLPFTHGHAVPGQPGATGLGLHVARQVAHMMDGEVDYRRDDGRTLFRLTLPRAHAEQTTDVKA